MGIRTDIKAAIKELLHECNTVSSLYKINWSTSTIEDQDIDPGRLKPEQFPYVGIGFPEEYSESQDENVINRSNMLTCNLWIIPRVNKTTEEDIEDTILDIKRFIGNNHSLNGTVFLAWYDRYKLFTNQPSGLYYGVNITLKIRYFEDKLNP